MANLHNLVRGAIGSINPDSAATLYRSSGYAISPDGKQVPQYAPPAIVRAQVQQLSQQDIQHLLSLNVQGSQRVIYLNGSLNGVVRVQSKGGDLVVLENGEVWLVTAVIEQWPDWCKVAVTLQNEDSVPFFPSTRFYISRNSQYVPLLFGALR